ncbi:hypothetical protein J1614_003337 [Plenodomus biglobosus]|nr:hypothetical protein J1614_003337 [Plenodomus biglobosus]
MAPHVKTFQFVLDQSECRIFRSMRNQEEDFNEARKELKDDSKFKKTIIISVSDSTRYTERWDLGRWEVAANDVVHASYRGVNACLEQLLREIKETSDQTDVHLTHGRVLKPENLGRNYQDQAMQTDGIEKSDAQPRGTQIDNVKKPDVQTRAMQTDDVKKPDIQGRAMQTDNIKNFDVQARGMQTDDIKTANVRGQAIQTEDMKPDVQVRAMQTEGTKKPDVQVQETQTTVTQTKDAQTQSHIVRVKSVQTHATQMPRNPTPTTQILDLRTRLQPSHTSSILDYADALGLAITGPERPQIAYMYKRLLTKNTIAPYNEALSTADTYYQRLLNLYILTYLSGVHSHAYTVLLRFQATMCPSTSTLPSLTLALRAYTHLPQNSPFCHWLALVYCFLWPTRNCGPFSAFERDTAGFDTTAKAKLLYDVAFYRDPHVYGHDAGVLAAWCEVHEHERHSQDQRDMCRRLKEGLGVSLGELAGREARRLREVLKEGFFAGEGGGGGGGGGERGGRDEGKKRGADDGGMEGSVKKRRGRPLGRGQKKGMGG